MTLDTRNDEFRGKGAVEPESPEQDGNTSLQGQLGHRNENPLVKGNDTDFPEPGENPEHSGEQGYRMKERSSNDERQQPKPEAGREEKVDQDPGNRQKDNQNKEKEDPLAA